MPNSRKINDARDIVGSEIGQEASNITVGKDNAHATADVNVTLGQVAAMSEREMSQVNRLVAEVSALRNDVNALVRELLGNDRYGSVGVIQRLNTAEGRQTVNRLALSLFAISEVVQWAFLIYWFTRMQ